MLIYIDEGTKEYVTDTNGATEGLGIMRRIELLQEQIDTLYDNNKHKIKKVSL